MNNTGTEVTLYNMDNFNFYSSRSRGHWRFSLRISVSVLDQCVGMVLEEGI